MKKERKWFSLIEIIIATWIITISVFWVYKIIWENFKIINNSYNTLSKNQLFPVFEQCLENLTYSGFLNKSTWQEYSIYLWNNLQDCQISNNLSIMDSREYRLTATISDSWINFIKWVLIIDSLDSNTINSEYILLKK